ncbi:4Fe-4S dicluster domain-containing protein [Serpentinicella alkaliphila]|uniref:Reductive dehalogenase n=1 Tax=Serpentinicella alkaliphila TaxID=1734049 RepID=A0A4R2U4L2_9FIRM|nr:reductive dehalogenase domain-containing protein [Serpentinicella alkaliphila]QUH24622.1 4Fe-4S dicluster domain-containing protein [Serpentinicella alkaliphila]TCQ02623.1 reductive dehalogenase [Serpentinicella alkaliphila]
MKRIDERDVIFSRMNYEKGAPEYIDYYNRNPHMKEIDDTLRSMPQMGSEGTATYSPISSPIVDACFRFLGDIKKYSEGEKQQCNNTPINIEDITEQIKGIGKLYNAKLVGVTEMKEYHYYSHRGRHKENYGEVIDKTHKYGIVFAVEMDKEMIYRAPQLSEAIATTKGYIDTAIIGMVLSYYIRELGYDARNHMDGNYLVVAPLIAKDAGLGEIGRNGLLITKKYGPRVRLGVVTTNLPLVTDSPINFGISQFCVECEKCVKTCPGKAIPAGLQEDIEGEKRWKINSEECYRRWRMLGTDCGICLASCPLSENIPEENINKILDCKSTRDEILETHEKKHGIRPYIKEKPSWLKY